jgi:hypothetical protein
VRTLTPRPPFPERERGRLIGLLAVFLLAVAAAAVQADSADPVLWPEAQRAFLQDGPGLLLTLEQRRELLALDETGRDSFLERFLADPIPATPGNELVEGIERRRRLAFDSLPPGDARAQLVFLLGPPGETRVIDCGSTFRPLEIWSYGAAPAQRRFVLYRPSADQPFRVWLPIDSKRALYTPQMAEWIYQWTAVGMGGKRIDRRFCQQSAEVDAATGIDGLRSRPEEKADVPAESEYRWTAPEDRVSDLAHPTDLAGWARKAAATPLPPEPPRLAVETLDLDFPDRREQRMVSRILISLRPPGAEGGAAVATDEGKPKVRLMVDGIVEREGSAFDALRVRYRLPVPEQGPIALFLERTLRPEQSFLLRLRIRDEVSGAEARVVRGFRVPSRPEVRLAPKVALAAARGEMLPAGIGGRDSVLLMPPVDEVMLGTWRADAMVSGDRIAKVVFLVDGEAQLSRTRPPYSAEVRLAAFPREQVVRVEGYDSAGELVSADQVTVNQTRGAFRVTVAEPEEGARIARRGARVMVRAEVAVPEDRRVESVEMKVNDRPVATLTTPPWQTEVDVPDEEIVHLAVTAQLDDGHRAEAVRFLRAPENLEQVEVNLVELYTTVTDGSGNLLRGLKAEDFQVLEAGRPQTIARFELVENLPLTLGFAILAGGGPEGGRGVPPQASASRPRLCGGLFLASLPRHAAHGRRGGGEPVAGGAPRHGSDGGPRRSHHLALLLPRLPRPARADPPDGRRGHVEQHPVGEGPGVRPPERSRDLHGRPERPGDQPRRPEPPCGAVRGDRRQGLLRRAGGRAGERVRRDRARAAQPLLPGLQLGAGGG